MTTKWMDESYALSRTMSSLRVRDDEGRGLTVTGHVRTRYGIVAVYSHESAEASRDDYTMLEIVHRGRVYYRTARRAFSERGLATLAGQFARLVTRTLP